MNIDFGKLVKEKMAENMDIYAAAHKEGYRLGFADGLTEAKKIIDATIGPLTAACPTCGGKGKSTTDRRGNTVYYCGCES